MTDHGDSIVLHPHFAEVCWLMGVASTKHPCCLGCPDMCYVREVAFRFLVQCVVPWETAREMILDGDYNPADRNRFKVRSRREMKRIGEDLQRASL